LIVVDYQNDFVSGALGFLKAQDIEEVIIRKIQDYELDGGDVIFTLDTHDNDYLKTVEGKNLPIPHCLIGTEGHAIYGKVRMLSEKHRQFKKPTFPSLDLANYLKSKCYDTVELCGVVSNICVLSNAVMVKAALPNSEIIIDSQAIAGPDNDLSEKAMDIMAGLHMRVLNR
jgi:nicotinamidase-related amidase